MKKNAFAALTLFLATMSGQQGNIVPGNAVNGEALYYTDGCYACHGYNGETGARAFVGHWDISPPSRLSSPSCAAART